jgi:Triphosphoribosyl-dephospho-CoA synthetase
MKYIINKILGNAILSLLLEASATPKPSGIDKINKIKKLSFENYLSTISYISYYYYLSIMDGIKGKFKIGKRIYEATKSMMENQSGGNTSFGSILLQIPLITSTAYYLYRNKNLNFENIRETLGFILNNCNEIDSIYICKAILLLKPTWLLKVDKYDLTKRNWLKEIKENKAKPKDIMKVAEEFDWIAYEYVNDYEITFKENFPAFMKFYEEAKELNSTIIKTIIWILSRRMDSHVYRTKGFEVAKYIMENARESYKRIEKGENIFKESERLRKKIEIYEANTGTTLDLVTACLFLALFLIKI